MKFTVAVFCVSLSLAACGDKKIPAEDASAPQQAAEQSLPTEPVVSSGNDAAPYESLPEQLGIGALSEAWTGDLDAMAERRVIRVLTVYGLPRYFIDGVEERGLTLELFRLFENFVNERYGRKHLRIHVAMVPVARDELISGLLSGRGDIAAAGLTITNDRSRQVDFTRPLTKELSEILVTGPAAPLIESIEDLAGRSVSVRPSSSYRASLESLNSRLIEAGLAEIVIEDVSPHLEDEDLLEMVNTGLLDWAVVDDYKAEVWADVFKNLNLRRDIVFRSGGRVGYAIRKQSPGLMSALNEFVGSHRQGSLQGNILINRYLKDYDWANNALAQDDYARFARTVDIFKNYGEQYGIDYLLATAQGYQESRLDQSSRSPAGAIGIMQLLPTTAADPNVGIPEIEELESNIHAGMKYLDFIRSRYFDDPEIKPLDRTLFALAAYNAGPARIAKLRAQATEQGYDANRWFDHVEVMAAREIGRETVQYVANILKYYAAYRLSMETEARRDQERTAAGME